MKLIANLLALPSHTVNAAEMQIAAGKTAEDARKTIENTGFTELRHVKSATIESFLETLAGQTNLAERLPGLGEITALITVSQSQCRRIPNLATQVQKLLGLPQTVFCLDVIDGCNGFVKALHLADRLIEPGQTCLIVAGDFNSVLTTESILGTRILFGDGLGLSLVQKEDTPLPALIYSDGARGEFITAPFCGGAMQMHGFEVFRFTNTEIPKLFEAADWLEPRDPNSLFAFHQASRLVVDQICKRLGIVQADYPCFNSGKIGNLGAGSIPGWIANAGLPPAADQQLHCTGFGAGLSWGIASLRLAMQQNGVIDVDV